MPDEICSGYQREPHQAEIVAEREHPDGTREKLCRVCYNRWQLSDEDWPPKAPINRK